MILEKWDLQNAEILSVYLIVILILVPQLS